ncbi:SDR family NAD(P)-dependent oxidoreductase [Stappia stellulata]|uniref:SDR family NAD(P)-dependent oxidoreductase n=1 Tax=Stappia stellulata TaxID=71235 RepID=UPI0004087DAC|nr:SDR family NAD(P)-dependent oxidoreductase [Stappia stellulata]
MTFNPSDFTATPDDGVAWITGASSGIGAALARKLAGEGWRVAVTARSADDLHALAADCAGASGEIRVYPGDTTDAARMAQTVAEIEADAGPIALAVLNAGVYLPVDGTNPDLKAFHKSFDVNLGGTVNSLVPLVEAMRGHGRGQVALVASVAGYGGLPTSAAYGATKAGLINLAEALKFDLDRIGVRIQIVSPGFVDTPATKNNPFPMPHLMQVEEAAARLHAGLKRRGVFEITFPRRFTWQLKALQLLPYRWYFALLGRTTGWSKKGPPSAARADVADAAE